MERRNKDLQTYGKYSLYFYNKGKLNTFGIINN